MRKEKAKQKCDRTEIERENRMKETENESDENEI